MAAYINSVRGRSHVWGQCDCWTFVRDAVRALAQNPAFGSDLPPYDSALGAARVFKDAFPLCSLAAYAAPWHIRPVPASRLGLAAPGDILAWQPIGDPVPHFAVIAGRVLWECTDAAGVVGTPLLRCLLAAPTLDAGLTIYRVAVA